MLDITPRPLGGDPTGGHQPDQLGAVGRVTGLDDFDVHVDLLAEGLPTCAADLAQRLGFLDARVAVRAGRPYIDLHVRAADEQTARSYAHQRVSLELCP